MHDTIKNPVEYARTVVGKDPMASHLGIEVEEAAEGFARCSITIRPQYLNAVERAHGAIVYAVADQAFAVACNSLGTMALALSMNINYIAGGQDGERITAVAEPVSSTRKISVWKIEVRGNGGRLIASCQGTAYHR